LAPVSGAESTELRMSEQRKQKKYLNTEKAQGTFIERFP